MTQIVAFYIVAMFFEIEILQKKTTNRHFHVISVLTLGLHFVRTTLDKATRVTGRDNFTGMASHESFLAC